MAQPHYIDPLTGMAFLLVRGGCFTMGDQFGDGFPDEKPLVEVCLDDYLLAQYPVTQGEWRQVMDANPAMFKKGERYPVEMVSFNSAMAFIERLNALGEGGFRLPTEAEWEYAARSGGKKEKWAGTSDLEELIHYAWHDRNSGFSTHPVGSLRPNGLGFHDMSGNLHEWVQDDYQVDGLAHLPRHNPVFLANSPYKGFRGGSWKRHAEGLRCTRRMGFVPDRGFGTFGLRLARDVPPG